jgi:hypothetical protein
MEASHLSSRPRIKTILNWGLKRSGSLLLRIEVSDSFINRALKFNSN